MAVIDERKAKQSYIRSIMFRILLVIFVGSWYYALGHAVLEEVAERNLIDLNTSKHVKYCSALYDEKDYGELMAYMNLYKLSGEHYDIYWEAVDGYLDYQRYLQWLRADRAGVENSGEKMEYYQKALEDNAAQCRHEENRELLEGYAHNVK